MENDANAREVKKQEDHKKALELEKAAIKKMENDANAREMNKQAEKKPITYLNGKVVVEGAKKGPKERPASDYKVYFPSSEGNPDSSFVSQDIKTQGLVIVFPMNVHDDSAIDQCEKLLKLKHENVIPHTGYYRDEANHLNITAELPLLADLHTRVNSKKYIKKYFSSIDATKITSRIVEGLTYCHD